MICQNTREVLRSGENNDVNGSFTSFLRLPNGAMAAPAVQVRCVECEDQEASLRYACLSVASSRSERKRLRNREKRNGNDGGAH